MSCFFKFLHVIALGWKKKCESLERISLSQERKCEVGKCGKDQGFFYYGKGGGST